MLLAGLCVVTSAARGQGSYAEDAVTAVLLERIASFLQWPGGAQAERPMRVVVLGRDKIGGTLSNVFESRPFAGRRLSVRYAARAAEVGDADIVFVGRQHTEPVAAVLRYCTREGLLTVADSPGYAAQGVALNFYRDGPRLRFEVRPSALKQAKIKASYKLLTLARIVGAP